jgi:hypothetical protein
MGMMKRYPVLSQRTFHPVITSVSYMMTTDEITKALPGNHKQEFMTELASALLHKHQHFIKSSKYNYNNRMSNYTREYFDNYLGSMISHILSVIFFKDMDENDQRIFLSNINLNVLKQIQSAYGSPLNDYNNGPNITLKKRFTAHREKLIKKLLGEKQAFPAKANAKERENNRIRTLLLSLKRLNPNGQIGQAVHGAKNMLKEAAKTEENQKRIENARKSVNPNNVRTAAHPKNLSKRNYDPNMRPTGRRISRTRNNSGFR